MIECAIIGGGPAGLTAGLYTTRGGLTNVVMFEKGLPGGQITSSSEIENYPGVSGDISGMDLMDPWLPQCSKFGLIHDMSVVKSVQKENNVFKIIKENNEAVYAKSVIICTGATPKKAGIKGEDIYFGRGVSTCATCDGFFYKNKEVAVLGGGDAALEEALYLSKICKKIFLIHRKDKFKAAPNTIKRIEETSNIEILYNTSIQEILGDNTGVNGLLLSNGNTLNVPGLFVFVGHTVNNSILLNGNKFLCNVDANGQIEVDLKMKTSVPGLFAAGDIRIDASRQVVCAAADGAVAALSAIDYLDKLSSF